MSVVTIMSGSFCGAEEVAQDVASRLQVEMLRDEDVMGLVDRNGGPEAGVLRRAIYGRTSIFNQFSHEKERAVSALKLATAKLLAEKDGLVLLGHLSLLVPRTISHVLEVCLIAETKYRAARAGRELGLGEKEALARVHRDDESAIRWAEYLLDLDPWDAKHYDILLPMDKREPGEAAGFIVEQAQGGPLAVTDISRQAAQDFLLAAQVEQVLSGHGHSGKDIQVAAKGGTIDIQVNKKVLRLNKLSKDLEDLAGQVAGVKEVKVEPGPGFYHADVYRQADFQLPSKVLLVDDEREFAQTLSERLLLREIGSAVAYDGEQALKMVAEDEPEVLVLDLKMPGIDGIEVLKRIKSDYPKVEVIILTGHGSQRDMEMCMDLGAFAYLEKPVDIDKLSQTMQAAYDKVRGQEG
ncbi:MAG: response regulator [Deltaproteobacteria bacterium]|nr:response regulator [Deltaproteobacteria bacterium]